MYFPRFFLAGKFIWFTVLLGVLVLIFWVLFSVWQFWKVLLVGAFAGGGVVICLFRPNLARFAQSFFQAPAGGFACRSNFYSPCGLHL